MFSTRYFRFLIVAAAALAACTDDPVDPAEGTGTDPVEDAEPASLTINFSIADLGIDVSTRAGEGDTGGTSGTDATNNNTTYCDACDFAKYMDPEYSGGVPTDATEKGLYQEAQFANGSMMTCLTVILVHRRSNRIVGIRRIPDNNCPDREENYDPNNPAHVAEAKLNSILDENGDLKEENLIKDNNGRIIKIHGTQARVTFRYEDPIHVVNEKVINNYAKGDQGKIDECKNAGYEGKSAERLLRGEYTIFAIANYDHRVTTSWVEGDETSGFETMNVENELQRIANAFHEPKNMAEGIYPFAPPVPNPEHLTSYEYLYNLRFLMNRTLSSDNIVSKIFVDNEQVKPYIRPAVHQTLTAAKDFYLEAGDNVLDIELQRISSRTRVEVKNYSEDQRLKVHSLDFSKNYTQSTTYLFRRNKKNEANQDRDYSELASIVTGKYDDHDGKGAPKVDYTGIYNYFGGKTYGAIVPFVMDWDSDVDGVKDGIIVEPVKNGNNKKCIFDALMYESHLDYKDEEDDPDSFYYTIDVSYPDINNYVAEINKIDQDKTYEFVRYDDTKISYDYAIDNNDHYIKPTTDIKSSVYDKIAEIEDKLNKDEKNQPLLKGESLCFFIQGINSSKYLYEKEDGTLYAEFTSVDPKSEGIDMDSYLWVLEKDNTDNYCYLKNVRSGKYLPEIPNPQDDKVVYMTSIAKDENKKFNFGLSDLNYDGSGHTGTYNITFSRHFDEPYTYNKTTYSDCYLSVWAGGPNLSGYSIADQGCQYRLYPIIRTRAAFYKGTPRMKKKIELTTFSDKTGYVEKVREIKRNDFIRILVEVSYNTKTNDFQFLVNDWDDKKGGVEFN